MQTLVPETEDGKTVAVLIPFDGSDHRWIDSVPDFLREHMLPALGDRKSVIVRVTWSIED
jgi:hypothetical protein